MARLSIPVVRSVDVMKQDEGKESCLGEMPPAGLCLLSQPAYFHANGNAILSQPQGANARLQNLNAAL